MEEQSDSQPNGLLKILIFIFVAISLVAVGYGLGRGTLKLGNLQRQGSRSSQSLDFSSVQEVYETLQAEYDGEVDTAKIVDGMKQGIAQSTGDPYTEYFNTEGAKEFQEELQGEFTGIGAELGKEDDAIVIISPIAGFPAEKAGLRPKDILVEINGESALKLTISEAVKKIRGPENTSVKLRIIRDGTQDLTLDITRALIKVPSVTWEIKEGNIGYLKIARFSEDTASLTRTAAAEFSNKDVTSVVLDLRSNPGGELIAAVDIASLWIDNGETVLLEKTGGKIVKTYTAKGGNSLGKTKTVILQNEGSASASEILAGALRDTGHATIVGDTSFGKGSVQQLLPLNGGGLLKVTIARWFTPKDKNIDKEGLEPDVKVERTSEDFAANRDPQLDKAVELVK